MPKLRDISGRKLVTVFEGFGFATVSQKGSHIKMSRVRLGMEQTLVIPNHMSVSKGTLKAIYSQALKYVLEKDLRKFFYS